MTEPPHTPLRPAIRPAHRGTLDCMILYRAIAHYKETNSTQTSRAYESEEEAFLVAAAAKNRFPEAEVRIQYSPVPEEGQDARWLNY